MTPPPAFSTERRDNWWLQPLAIVLGLGLFGLYATWAALVGEHFLYTGGGAHYLSPFYSPCLVAEACGWATIPLLESFVLSPAILILWAPLGLRVTCYYYRKAYYRSFFADPPACAVGEPRGRYHGETKFPFVLQNLHRYFLYASIIVVTLLWYDTLHAFNFGAHGSFEFGVGLGSLVLLANVVLLSGFTFGCHAFRHLVGGGADCFSCSAGARARHGAWKFSTWFNEKHMTWAWLSLFSVAFADLFVRLLSMGIINDVRLI